MIVEKLSWMKQRGIENPPQNGRVFENLIPEIIFPFAFQDVQTEISIFFWGAHINAAQSICQRVCVCVYCIFIISAYFLENLCERQEFVISNKIFYMDSFPFFPKGFLSVFFCNSISDSREALLLVFSQPLLSPLPLPQSTGVKDRPFPDWYLPIK